MEMSLSEQLMYSTVLIKCQYKDGIGSGTGFIFNFLEKDGKCVPAIITNCHVIKDSILTEFEFCLKDEKNNPDNKSTITVKAPSNLWIVHPDGLDLCCLLIGGIINNLEKENKRVFYIPISSSIIPDDETISKLHAMENLVMIGYPIGISDTFNHKPVLRKGITASHLKNDYFGKREFLMDMPCFPGSSGSPIFILDENAYMIGNSLIPGNRVLFVGILWGGPQHNAEGKIIQYSIPNFCTNTPIPTNLGYAIKSSQLFRFEEEIKLILEGKNNRIDR